MIYKTQGTCASAIDLEIKDGCIEKCDFIGGCNGNTQGISALVKGMKVEDVVQKVKGIKCGMKNTSCPDQLALVIEKALQQANN